MPTKYPRHLTKRLEKGDRMITLEQAGRASAVHQQAIELAARFISEGYSNMEVTKRLQQITRQHYSSTAIALILGAARAQLALKLGQSKEKHRSESLEFYLRLSRDPAADPATRIRARERIDKLLGLESPTRNVVEVTIEDISAGVRNAIGASLGSIPAAPIDADYEVIDNGSPPEAPAEYDPDADADADGDGDADSDPDAGG